MAAVKECLEERDNRIAQLRFKLHETRRPDVDVAHEVKRVFSTAQTPVEKKSKTASNITNNPRRVLKETQRR